MRFNSIDLIASTFHDFDLINISVMDGNLKLNFKCCWNEMNDEENPWMYFEFTFPNATLICYELVGKTSLPLTYECNSSHEIDIKPLVDSEVFVNDYNYKAPNYEFYALPNKDVGAVFRIHFESDTFEIKMNESNIINLHDYLELHELWWQFIAK